MKESTAKKSKSKVIDVKRLQELDQAANEIRDELRCIVKRLLGSHDLDYDEIVEKARTTEFKEIFNEEYSLSIPNIPKLSSNSELQSVIELFFFHVAHEGPSDRYKLIRYYPYGFETIDRIEALQEYARNNQVDIDYYNVEYRKKRHEVFLRDGEMCGRCGAVPKVGVYLTIDHIKPVSKYPELFLDIDNMQVLCNECNQEKSNKHETDYRK